MHCTVPHISVPQQHVDGVDHEGLAELDDDALPVVVVDRVSGEAPVQVVRAAVSVQQRRLHLAAQDLAAVA